MIPDEPPVKTISQAISSSCIDLPSVSKTAIIIGSGIAGIASALRLRKQGYDVTVFEANSYVGGKVHVVEQRGYRWDAGPSLFTMPQLVDELFELFDVQPQTYFRYKQKDTVCNYFWEDGTTFSAHADKQTFVQDASATFETPSKRIWSYLESAKTKYDLTSHIFLEKSLHTWSTYLNRDTLHSLLQSYKLDLMQPLDQVNARYFSSPHLRQLFNRYATYNGSSPYRTPGIMSMIPHLEMHMGTFFPEGGMHAISQSLFQLAQDQGILFRLSEAVNRILHRAGQAHGVETAKGSFEADVIVSNMDIFSTYKRLLPDVKHPQKILKQERSSSALIFYWGIKERFPQLDLHNIFFGENYQEEFRHIFDLKQIHEDPTIYLNISSKEKLSDAPSGCENWFVMINTPGNFGQDWEEMKRAARASILQKLNRMLKTEIEPLIEAEEILEPITIEQKTSSHRGSLYGASSNSQFAAFLRHPNFSRKLKQLYFCGGSVHPGGGIPLCLLSAKIVSDLISEK
ncbi:MAG: 1-hydroxycarotenoid 3,4-desaturase CrtD [Bacteroidota bacterium]